MIWRIGNGFTAASKLWVKKSQKILGQKKPSNAAAIWSTMALVSPCKLVLFPSGHPIPSSLPLFSLHPPPSEDLKEYTHRSQPS